MNPRGAPFGITSRHRPGRGNLITARQRFGAARTTGTPKPSRGMSARASCDSPVTTPTTSYHDRARGNGDQLQVEVERDTRPQDDGHGLTDGRRRVGDGERETELRTGGRREKQAENCEGRTREGESDAASQSEHDGGLVYSGAGLPDDRRPGGRDLGRVARTRTGGGTGGAGSAVSLRPLPLDRARRGGGVTRRVVGPLRARGAHRPDPARNARLAGHLQARVRAGEVRGHGTRDFGRPRR